jgi:hypothetical protein
LAASAPGETPWYTQTWFVVLLLFIFFPAGLILMWTQTTWHTAVKWVVSALPIIWILFLVALIYSFSATGEVDSGDDEPAIVTPIETIP